MAKIIIVNDTDKTIRFSNVTPQGLLKALGLDEGQREYRIRIEMPVTDEDADARLTIEEKD